MKPIDLDDPNQADIHTLRTSEDVATLIACAASSRRYLYADLKGVCNKAQLLERFAETLKFPDYFGHNWDALYDVLCDREWFGQKSTVLHLNCTNDFKEHAADDWLALREILEEAIGYWRSARVAFWVFVEDAPVEKP